MSNAFKKLWESNTVRLGALYLGAGWLVLQVAIALEGTLSLPDWVDQSVLVLVVLGFPAVILVATLTRGKVSSDTDEGTEVESLNPQAKNERALIRSDKPTIAVLPFTNKSGESDQNFLAEGMTDDLVTRLTIANVLAVASRTSTLAIKDEKLDIKEIGERLQVAFVVDGSVRRMNDRVRVSVQLTRAATGELIWAENYDRPFNDWYEIQDDVISDVVAAVGSKITRAEVLRTSQQRPEELSAWELVNRNDSMRMFDGSMREFALDFIRQLEEATIREPEYAPVHAQLASRYAAEMFYGWETDVEGVFKRVDRELAKALALGPDDLLTIGFCSVAYTYTLRFDEAIELCEHGRSIYADDNFLDYSLGFALMMRGDFDDAAKAFDRSESNGYDLAYPGVLGFLRGVLVFLSGDYDGAKKLLKKAMDQNISVEVAGQLLAVSLVELGQMDEARKVVGRLLEDNPALTISTLRNLSAVHPSQERAAILVANAEAVWPPDRA